MRNKGFYILLLLLITFSGHTQPYGNEWIEYNQQYFAVPIHEKGVYRLDYNTMLNAGVPLGSFDPRSFQVFARGEEQAIYVKNQTSGIFNPGDYIEFFAEKNDGWFDNAFYSDGQRQPNANFSLINDTITYYLTWNNSLNNKRYSIEQDSSFEGYTPAPFFWSTSRQDYTSQYYAGETNNYGVTEPRYTEAEGWFDGAINLGQSKTKTIPTPHIYTAGPSANIEFALAGASNYRPLDPDHHLQVQFAGSVVDTLYEGYKLIHIKKSIPANNLNIGGTAFVFSSVNSIGSPVDRSAIAFVSVRYPRSFNMGNQNNMHIELPVSSGSKTLIRFTDFDAQESDTVWIYDLNNNSRTRAFSQNGVYNALISNPTQLRELFLTTHTQIKKITQIKPVSGNPDAFARFTNYLSSPHVDSDYLMISHKNLMEEAKNYQDFRNNTGHKVLLTDVDELYHQFSYGIKKHPLAIRNFIRFTLDEFQQKPDKLFLIGKTRGAMAYRKNSHVYASSLVPSFANPPSDILISSGLDGHGYAPALATGRLAAQTPAHVGLYLDKAIQYHYNQQTPQEWMKNILHFGGGSSINEQNVLASYLQQYKNTMEDTLFGGYIRTFLKSSTDPIQINQSDSLKQIINNGVSFMTFFGHAAGIGFDISIDYPSEYNNFGKYPFLVANSCFAGDIFGSGVNSSEEFVLIEEKGVIGYLAATSATGAYELNRYSNKFFQNISGKDYGKPVGHILRATIREIQNSNLYIRNVCLLNTLHGDPAVVLNAQPKPDYTVKSSDIFFSPKEVTTEIDSFSVHIISTNIGKAIKDSMFVDLQQKYPDGSIQIYTRRVRTALFKDTLTFRLPIDREKGLGINQFMVTLDALGQIDELNKTNNTATNNIFIKSSDIIPIYPLQYAMVPSENVTLKASTGDPFVKEKNYVFQIDTSPSFTNPLSQTITRKGGVVQWRLPLSLTDSTVYFWRVSIDSVYNGSYSWRESSFQYMDGLKGWSQAHFNQFKNNRYSYVAYNKEDEKFDFINSVNSILAQTGIYPYLAWTEQFIRVNGITMVTFSCLADVGNGMLFMVFDPVSADIQKSINQGSNLGQFDNYHCFQRDMVTFDYYSTSELWRDRMQRFVDTIPQGHYVLALSHRNHNAQNYPEKLYQAFETLGSANIRNITNNTPYLLFGRKGSPAGSANEIIGASITSTIQLNDSIITNWNKGYIVSEIIGPARSWESIHWKQQSLEETATDSVWLNVLGISADGSSDTLMTKISPQQDIITLNTKIDATRYPFLQLMVVMSDDVNRTPAQMEYWNVVYEGIPETALDPSLHYVFEKDSVPEGKPVLFSTAIHNISEYAMDSLLVNYWIIDQNRQLHPLESKRLRTHTAGDILTDTINIPTKGLAGNNSLWIEVNPSNDQMEQHLFNNVGQIPFFVQKDKTNPLLELTFDGVQIMDGDIVSAKPFVHMRLLDENPFLPLSDTTLLKVFLKTPEANEEQRIYFNKQGKENMRFYPATLPDNTCSIEYEPTFEMDGTYNLRVQATDNSLNESGKNDHVISFEVVNKSTITEILNWPNPFTTATHFVFTLTGSQLPTYMKIQILTITGRVVREIDMAELGPIRIGRNITQFAWDGTDQYGDRLANGVYLYRVITNIDGQQIELNSTSASKYFHEGFGKMYLMR